MTEIERITAEILKKFDARLIEKTKGFLTAEDAEKIKVTFTETISKFNEKGLQAFNAEIKKLDDELITVKELSTNIKEISKKQALSIEALQQQQILPPVRKNLTKEEQLKILVVNSFNSKEFKDFQASGYKGHTHKMSLDNDDKGNIILIDTASVKDTQKAVIDMTSHTGTVMISEIMDRIRDDTPVRKKHVRDLLNVSSTSSAQIVAGQVTGWSDAVTLGAAVLSENTAAPESVFTSQEQTWSLKRIANSMRISKRWLKVNGLDWVINHVLAKLPDATYTVEDFQLLFGDGAGNNVEGLAKQAQMFDLTPNVYVATDFASIATYNSGAQTKVTFDAIHSIKNGDSLTIANATSGAAATAYNKIHTAVIVYNAYTVIIDASFVADANVAANWTGASQSIFYQSIEAAQEYDVLAVARALLISGEFGATGHVLNPQQQIQMGLLKATDANYLNIEKDANGDVIGVGGLPIATTTAMPTGKFLTGDFSRMAAELKEFTAFNLQFVEDVSTAKQNEIVIIVEEEIIFPVYNPLWYIFGKFAIAKEELETP